MKARTLTLAALAAFLTACGGGGEEGSQAGDSATPGATGTIESTSDTISGASTPVDTLTASDATTAGGNGSATAPTATGTTPAPNAPPATATPATQGDTTAGDTSHTGH